MSFLSMCQSGFTMSLTGIYCVYQYLALPSPHLLIDDSACPSKRCDLHVLESDSEEAIATALGITVADLVDGMCYRVRCLD